MNTKLEKYLYDLVVSASTDLPLDVENALAKGLAKEIPGSAAAAALEAMIQNIALARTRKQPICQDTGTIIFHVTVPENIPFSQRNFRAAVEIAVIQATDDGVLRQNSVCPLSGKNSGNNLGPGSPVIHYHEGGENEIKVALILKGGGCENVGIQYSLPDHSIDAGRDLEGVRKCILDAAIKAQGRGCAPGILSVVVGGDRSTGYEYSKEQLLRKVGSRSENPLLAEMEEEMLEKGNLLGIGPMGLGGKTTLLDVFICEKNRVPASYFVSISYMCWAFRRQAITISLTDLGN